VLLETYLSGRIPASKIPNLAILARDSDRAMPALLHDVGFRNVLQMTFPHRWVQV
jgi:hypothetical protein